MKKILSIVLMLLVGQVYATVQVKDVVWSSGKAQSSLQVKFEGNLGDVPNWEIFGKTFVMTIPSAHVASAMTKKITDQNLIKVTQKNAQEVKLTFTVDQNTIQRKEQIALNVLDGKIEVVLPMVVVKNTKPEVVPTVTQLDESYLDKLVNESIEKKKPAVEETKIVREEIKTIASAHKRPVEAIKSNKSDYSLGGIAFKMIMFLAVVLGIFYGIIMAFKKGVVSKGKLGFLNNTDLVQVLNTTHLGNKKSLILVKVHQQAFLISNTERDLQFIAEVKNLPGLIKEGERQVAGDNFDTNFSAVENSDLDSVITLKENILESKELPKEEAATVKFSEQIKNKVKGLRPLQQ